MMISVLKELYLRDLGKLKAEIELYKDEQKIWYVEKEIANSAGNLCLHLVGNLNTYIGGVFGETGYIRDRDLEFSARNVPKAELIKGIENAMLMITSSFDRMNEDQLMLEYPSEVREGGVFNGYFLTHLAMHLSYHLGQINYHRRLLDN